MNQSLIRRAAERYAEMTPLRAAVQAIPFIGGSLDILLGGEGQKIQQRRVEHFLTELDQRLKNVEQPTGLPAEDELLDLMFLTFDRVVSTRSASKRGRFAEVIARQVSESRSVDEAETALRLIGELEDMHVEVLKIAVNAPRCPTPWNDLRLVTIAEHPIYGGDGKDPLRLQQTLPKYPLSMLRLACSELVAKGLFKDEGGNRWDTKPMEYFVATDLAEWLYTWIKND